MEFAKSGHEQFLFAGFPPDILMNTFTSEEIIDLFISSLPADASDNDAQILREALQRLVKVAQFEQAQAIQKDFEAIERIVPSKTC